jgi:hypothetical protein
VSLGGPALWGVEWWAGAFFEVRGTGGVPGERSIECIECVYNVALAHGITKIKLLTYLHRGKMDHNFNLFYYIPPAWTILNITRPLNQ